MLGAKNMANLVDDFGVIVSGGIINPDEAFLQVSGAQRLGEANAKKGQQKCFEQHWNPGERRLVNIFKLSVPEHNRFILRSAAALATTTAHLSIVCQASQVYLGAHPGNQLFPIEDRDDLCTLTQTLNCVGFNVQRSAAILSP